MGKARSQLSHPLIKKEEGDHKSNLDQLLHGTTNTTKNRTKVTTKRTSKVKVVIYVKATRVNYAKATRVKLENTNDVKPMLTSPKAIQIKPTYTNEQIATFMRYIVNDKMPVAEAAKKVNMPKTTARTYYAEYLEDPEHKIPLARSGDRIQSSRVTQEKLEEAIHCIVHDKMSITQASEKAQISRKTAVKYYKKYLEDPERKIPKLEAAFIRVSQGYKQEQVNNLIHYIVKNKMKLEDAAKKAKIGKDTAKRYYLKYIDDPKHRIPVASAPYNSCGQKCTNEQVKTLIEAVVKDGVTLLQASVRANMGRRAATKYYQQYLDDPEHQIPTPENEKITFPIKRHTTDQLKTFFRTIIVDNLNIAQASRKANMSENSGYFYYKTYIKGLTKKKETIDSSYSVEKMKVFLKYIQKNKMSITTASKRANLCRFTAKKYYQMYLNDPKRQIPVMKQPQQQYTDDDKKRLVFYIENHKMRIMDAAKKARVRLEFAYRYYRAYRKNLDQKNQLASPMMQRKNRRGFDRCSQIVADICKENPSIRPIH